MNKTAKSRISLVRSKLERKAKIGENIRAIVSQSVMVLKLLIEDVRFNHLKRKIEAYWLLILLPILQGPTHIADLSLAAHRSILLRHMLCIPRYCHFWGCFALIFLTIIIRVSKASLTGNSIIDVYWYVFLFPCDYPMWKLVSLLKFLVVAAALEGRLGLEELFHFFEKSIGPK